MKKIKGYKGYDKNLKCRDFQYEIGKSYKMEDDPKICEKGFHFCENPFDVFNYYPLTNENRFTEVEGIGNTDKQHNDEDSKVVVSHIKIGAELNLKSLINSAINFVFEKVKYSEETSATTGNYAHSATTGNYAHSATTGDYAHSATTGYSAHSVTTGDYAHSATTGNYAHSATTGNYAHSATTGYSAHSEVNGKESIAAGLGMKNKAKGKIGCWLVLSEWENINNNWIIKDIKTIKVDGEIIKEDTLYCLKNGEFIVD
jgi:hypothetical protein